MPDTCKTIEDALIQYEMKKDLPSRTAVIEGLYTLLCENGNLCVVVAGIDSLRSQMLGKNDDAPSIETEDGKKIRLASYKDGDGLLWQTAFTSRAVTRSQDHENTVEMPVRELFEYIVTSAGLFGILLNSETTPMFLPKAGLIRILQLLS